MDNVFFTSDFHFFHKNIIEYSGRPWSYEDQTEELIARWNSKVGVMDDVYHLGDFAFAGVKKLDKTVEIINQLNGNIHFIRGNHCHRSMWRQIDDMNISHIEWIKDFAEIKVQRQKIVLCHYALRHWNNCHHGSWNLHGHSHGSLPPIGKQLDVGIDNHPEFQVYSMDEVKDFMDKREMHSVDHHN